ncbi:hypothetical protein F1847_07860 [Thermodesulfobacterium sp. TA1]|uniref:NrfD/PsrC family molybdoenzyme membrane anchor subunit n=1 Tax=Thermodesulfobacterium sp. TA1 TaxID=2234087 RepID=UPI00123248C1|nr:NrfD/PsrC family molybdoenzyme membrane anchor subunit [Thermodesulfobacterium sp. TA1]QER42656.1 hypothetical protein F1847_07860 [Thermodesulfobacterium sp. TA1]
MEKVEAKGFKQKLLLAPDFKTYIVGLFTPWNLIAGIILLFGFYAIAYRLIFGLGPATNLNNDYPWGLWIAFDILAGIALAAPGLTVGTAVYLFGMKEYKSFAKPAILSSLVGYVFAVIALLFDLGRYYRVFYPIIWSWGLESVLFLVGWHFFLYIMICLVEWFPVFFEWLGKEKAKNFFASLGVWATAFGVIIAGGHQSALGALFLIAPTKVHPLWYSPLLPLFFLISAIAAGVSIVVIESTITHRFFKQNLKEFNPEMFDRKTLGLGKALAVVLSLYLFLKVLDLVHQEKLGYFFSSYGILFVLEHLIFVICPLVLLSWAIKAEKAFWVRISAFWVALGIIFNRVVVCLIAYNWYIPWQQKYYPSWMEVALSLSMATMIVLSSRFMLRRLPILSE